MGHNVVCVNGGAMFTGGDMGRLPHRFSKVFVLHLKIYDAKYTICKLILQHTLFNRTENVKSNHQNNKNAVKCYIIP